MPTAGTRSVWQDRRLHGASGGRRRLLARLSRIPIGAAVTATVVSAGSSRRRTSRVPERVTRRRLRYAALAETAGSLPAPGG